MSPGYDKCKGLVPGLATFQHSELPLKKVTIFFLAISLIGCGANLHSSTKASPETNESSFDSIDNLSNIFGDKISAYRGMGNCGSVRIHDEKPIFLTAMHCLIGEIEASREVTLGSEIEYDSMVYFNDQTGKITSNNLKILAHGDCFTGLGLDIVNIETKENQALAIACAAGDWLIYEDLSQDSTTLHPKCASPGEPSGSTAYALGAPQSVVVRNGMPIQLDGRVYSKGSVLEFESLHDPAVFPFSDITSFLLDHSNLNAMKNKMLLTNADVVKGMSGGPILDQNFNLVGVTTMKLAPNSLWRYDGYTSHDDFMNASHAGIKSGTILRELEKKGQSNLFKCANALDN